MRKTTGLAIPLFFILCITNAQTGKEPVKVTDLLKIQTIGNVTLNKDGSKAAFAVTVIEPDADSKWDYKYVNHIYVVPADGSAPPKELTVKEGSSQPAWSPDGRQLAFVRTVDGKPQVFLLSLDGGEPVQFTHFRYGAGTPRWSPDGRQILFSSNVKLKELVRDSLLNPGHTVPSWPYEQPGTEKNEMLQLSTAKMDPDGSPDEIRAYLDNDVTDKKAKVVNKLDFQDETGVNAEMSFNIWSLQGIAPRSLPVAVTHGFYRYETVDFITDGRLLLVGNMDSTQHPDRALETNIYIAEKDGSNTRLLLSQKGVTFGNALASPSGQRVVFQYRRPNYVEVPQIGIISLPAAGAGGKDTPVVTQLPTDRVGGPFVWSTDEQSVYYTAPSNGGVPIYRVNIQTKKVESLSDPNSGTGSFDLRGGKLVFVKTEVSDPFELYSTDVSMQHAKRISSFNYEWVQHKQLVMPEKHVFTDDKGLSIEYWVMKPAGYEAGKKYPLLLDIHGGPAAMWGPGESSMWHEFQFFAAKGYGVLYCNPRGSGGYGQDFLRANIQDWGTGPTSDVLTALDKAVAEGWADTSRLVVTGGSYAGYLVAWIVGHDNRFKAACVQRGVYDLATFFGEGNAWKLVPGYFDGYPWQEKTRAILQRESPITYVDKIRTPLIIFHGENDRRTGFVQSEMLFRSLKVLGRPVEYVRHPGGTHELTRSGDNRQRIDQMLRTYEFFQRFIGTK